MDIKNTYLGFTNNLTPMQKARSEKLLDDIKRYDGTIMTNKEFIFNQVKLGSTPIIKEGVQYWSRKLNDYTKPKTEYRIKDTKEDHSFWVIEKTLYKFALYLIENDMTNEENIKRCITEEENKLKEEQELKEQQEKQKQQQEQEKVNFENWLNEEARKYNNTEKLDLLKQIFLAETGQYGGGSLRLLVLIDNFDNPMCKEKLRSWLSYYNTASLKAFFHLTGINLGRTDKAIQERLNSITSKDFQGMISFKPRKDKEEKELETFYTFSFDSLNNKYEYQECLGEHFKKYGLNFFISKSNKGYSITEGTSGLNAGTGKNKQETLSQLAENVNRIGIDRLQEVINNSIKKNGISPKYVCNS